MTPRPKQRDCYYEPPYPDHETILFTSSGPDHCAHMPMSKCDKDYPHLIAECRELQEDGEVQG